MHVSTRHHEHGFRFRTAYARTNQMQLHACVTPHSRAPAMLHPTHALSQLVSLPKTHHALRLEKTSELIHRVGVKGGAQRAET